MQCERHFPRSKRDLFRLRHAVFPVRLLFRLVPHAAPRGVSGHPVLTQKVQQIVSELCYMYFNEKSVTLTCFVARKNWLHPTEIPRSNQNGAMNFKIPFVNAGALMLF